MIQSQPQLQLVEDYFKAFYELSRQSLKDNIDLKMYTIPSEDLMIEYLDESRTNLTLDDYISPSIYKVNPIKDKKEIVAVDTSSIRIAESSRGVIIAVKGAVIHKRTNKKIKCTVIGPFLFYVTKKNFRKLLGEHYKPIYSRDRYEFYRYSQKIFAEILERKIQKYVAEIFKNTLILFDGSLTVSDRVYSPSILEEILKKCLENGNDVLAFSKTTSIDLEILIKQLNLENFKPPYLVDLTHVFLRNFSGIRLLGRVFLAHLTNRCPGYRVDAPLNVSDPSMLVGILVGNDPLIYGYPETLILAHDYSTFTKMDVITIHTLLRKMDIEIVSPTSTRDLLFNPIDGDVV
ncbi:MAG: DNA double-strand break repair nuclease NurA [Aigarchaeota archaeon]|nr:DNA double-strand break repair nuclease NurA [Candidatus Geocrenenecus dongiae]